MASPSVVEESAKSFEEKMRQTLMSGFCLVGLSLGAKLGLFEALSSVEKSVTSDELAAMVKCKERYVREWLYQMVMCDIVDVDESGTKFTLPAHRRHALIDPSQSVPRFAPAFPAMLIPHEDIVNCFHEDGPIGVPYERVMPFFVELSERNRLNLMKCVEFLKTQVPEIIDKFETGGRVLEVGCGEGFIACELASHFPKSTFVGIDLSKTLLAQAKDHLTDKGLTNVEVLLQDVTNLPDEWKNYFDFIYMRDVLHDIPHVTKALNNLHAVLKEDGLMSIFDIYLHSNPYKSKQNPHMKALGQMVYGISMYHCLAMSLGTPGSDGLGAGSGIENIVTFIEKAGFQVIENRTLVDLVNLHFLCKKKLL